MSLELQDRLLEQSLEEALGGVRPPDVAARVLSAWRAAAAGSAVSDATASGIPVPGVPIPSATIPGVPVPGVPVPGVPVPGVPVPGATIPGAPPTPPPVGVAGVAGSRSVAGRRANRERRRRRVWTVGVTAASMSLIVGISAVAIWRRSGDSETAREAGAGPSELAARQRPANSPQRDPSAGLPESPAPARGESNHAGQDSDLVERRSVERHGPALAPFDEPSFALNHAPAAAPPAPRDVAAPLPEAEVVERINALLAAAWKESAVATSEAPEEQWCRRVYLRMLGRIPTVGELRAFLADRGESKRRALIATLQSSEYRDEYAAHWAGYWANLLIGRRGGMEPGDPASHAGLVHYLKGAIESDRRFDDVAAELISATGAGRLGAPDYNGATNFLLASLDDKGVLATVRTMQVFHGRQLRCIQCHPHPANEEWPQDMFWQINSFFRQTRIERGADGARLVNRDFRGEGKGDLEEAEVYFQRLNGYQVAAYPAFPSAGPVTPSGRLAEIDRRATLAALVTRDPNFSRAIVNRLWQHFLGYGFTLPVDDMGPHNAPSHPDLLEHLARQFEAHDYRLGELTAWIALSDGFNRSSEAPDDPRIASLDAPERGRPLFARYYTRQLHQEAVFDSLKLIADSGSPAGEPGFDPAEIHARADWLGQFVQTMGTDEGEELSRFRGDVRQSLILMNGPLMHRATSANNVHGVLHEVVGSAMPFGEKVKHLFLAAVARPPQKRELALVDRLREAGGESAALENIWWALLNSNEFILDH